MYGPIVINTAFVFIYKWCCWSRRYWACFRAWR